MIDRLLTIIVPTYNRAALLPATIKSLQNQAFRDYEIIIVDDGSTDNTEDVIREYLNEYTKYYKKDNAERAAARNYGARLATGLYVNFFDSDDLAFPNHISEAAAVIKVNENPEWFHLGFEWYNPNNKTVKKNKKRNGLLLNKSLATGNHLGCNSVFVRRDIFLLNQFNEDRLLSASEDFELWLRLASKYRLYVSNTITSQLVDHDERSVNNINGDNIIVRMLRLKYYIEVNTQIQEFYRGDVKKIYADCYSYIALHISESPSRKFQSLYFFFKAFIQSPSSLFYRRSFAIFRNLIFRWQT